MALGFPLFLLCVGIAIVVIVVLIILFATGAFTAAAGGAVALSAKKKENAKGRKITAKVLIGIGITIIVAVIGVVIAVALGILNKINYSTKSMAAAARKEDGYAVIKEYLDNGEHPDSYYSIIKGNYKTEKGKQTPLTEICGLWGGDKHISTAKLLIQHGANVNYETKEGTPLQLAIEYRHYGLVNLLVNNGADLTVTDSSGRTPLMLSLIRESTDNCLQMINKGADVNAVDESGYPVMYYALSNDTDKSVIKALAEKGAEAEFTAPDGVPAICFAARNCDVEELELLAEMGVDLTRCDSYGANAIIYAVTDTNQLENIAWLVEHGVDINGKGRRGVTPLLMLCEKNRGMYYKDCMNTILDNGGDINAVDDYGKNALSLLASDVFVSTSDLETGYEVLVSRGIDVNKGDNNGVTPLMYLAEWVILEEPLTNCTNLLINGGADINLTDNEGNTALIHAARVGNFKAVRLLLEKGADKTIKNNSGKTAYDVASDGLQGNKRLVIEALEGKE